MEIILLIFSSILSVLIPGGLISEQIFASRIRDQTEGMEHLALRIDNVPSYQLIEGKIDRFRIASRGVELTKNFRVEQLEIETDPLDIDLQRLRQSDRNRFQASLRQPLNAGIKLALHEEDLNQTLDSPPVKARIQTILNAAAANFPSTPSQGYEILDLQLDLQENNRILFQAQLQPAGGESPEEQRLNILAETELAVAAGQKLTFANSSISVNKAVIPPTFTSGILSRVSSRLNLTNLEEAGILARVLQLEIEEEQVKVATFVRVEPFIGEE